MEDIIISSVKPEAFLVKDPSLKDINAPFLCWLRENDFMLAWHKGHYDSCDWVFVNITHKIFAYGMPGVQIVKPIGNHAIRVPEFLKIWNIYNKYQDLEPLVMDDDEDKARKTLVYYVRSSQKEAREKLVDYIESEGFTCDVDDVTNKDIILGSKYPLVIDVDNHRYSMLHNTTTSAAAVSSGFVITEAQFYVAYKKSDCSYEEYNEAVRDYFEKYKYSADEITEYFNRPDIESLIQENYQSYIGYSEAGASCPASVASCLDMLY